MQPVSNEGERQIHVGGGRYASHPAAHVKVGDRFFEQRLVWAVDQIESPGEIAQTRRDPVDGVLHRVRPQARGSEEGEHSGAAHRLDEFGGADAVRHGAGQITEADAVVARETGRAEVLGSAGGAHSEEREPMKSGISAHFNGSALREPKRLSMVHGVQGSSDTTEPPSELLRRREKAVRRPTPRADWRTGFDFQIRHRAPPDTGLVE